MHSPFKILVALLVLTCVVSTGEAGERLSATPLKPMYFGAVKGVSPDGRIVVSTKMSARASIKYINGKVEEEDDSSETTVEKTDSGAIKITAKAKTSYPVSLYDTVNDESLGELGSFESDIGWCSFSQSGDVIAAACLVTGEVKVWEMKSRKLVRTIVLNGRIAGSFRNPALALSPDGRSLLTVVDEKQKADSFRRATGGTLSAWEIESGNLLWKIEGTKGTSLAVAPEKDRFALFEHSVEECDDEGETGKLTLTGWGKLWIGNTKDGSLIRELDERTGALESGLPDVLQFLGNGDRLAGLCQRSVTLWDLLSGEITHEHEWRSPRPVIWFHYQFSVDGKRLGRAAHDWIEVEELESGKVVASHDRRTGLSATLYGAAFSADLSKLVGNYKQGAGVYVLSGEVPQK